MMNYFLVAIGGALGSVARFWCSGFAARQIGEWFPWGTLIVNVVGSFIIGAFAALERNRRAILDPVGNARLCHGWPVRRIYDFLIV